MQEIEANGQTQVGIEPWIQKFAGSYNSIAVVWYFYSVKF